MTEQSPNYLPEDPRPAALRLAEFVKGWASAWPEFSGAHKSGMETAAELLRLHAENQALATDFNVARDAYDAARLEIESIRTQMEAIDAGGVEPLRRGKCLHQIVEPPMKLVEHDEDWLEKMYWKFDAARQKSGDERLSFKGFMRGYGVKCVTDAAAQQPMPPNPGDLKPDLANIDSPFNACMYREECKRWKAAAHGITMPKAVWLPSDDTEGGAV